MEKLVQTYSVVEGLSANNLLKVPASNILNGGWQKQAANPARMSLDTDFGFYLACAHEQQGVKQSVCLLSVVYRLSSVVCQHKNRQISTLRQK